jgi:hypothetical protein
MQKQLTLDVKKKEKEIFMKKEREKGCKEKGESSASKKNTNK